jgi:hypothetical protein
VPGRERTGVSQSGRGEAELTAFLADFDHRETAAPAKARSPRESTKHAVPAPFEPSVLISLDMEMSTAV